MSDPNEVEAHDRLRRAAGLIEGAIRLGGVTGAEVERAVRSAVGAGADHFAQDIQDEYAESARRA